MILTSLQIERAPSYGANPNQLIGKVVVDSPESSHTITLTASELNKILEVVKETVSSRAAKHVKHIPSAFTEAQAETLLIENGGAL